MKQVPGAMEDECDKERLNKICEDEKFSLVPRPTNFFINRTIGQSPKARTPNTENNERRRRERSKSYPLSNLTPTLYRCFVHHFVRRRRDWMGESEKDTHQSAPTRIQEHTHHNKGVKSRTGRK